MRENDKKGVVDESWNPGCVTDGAAVEMKRTVADLDLAIKSAPIMPSLIGPLTNRHKVYVHLWSRGDVKSSPRAIQQMYSVQWPVWKVVR